MLVKKPWEKIIKWVQSKLGDIHPEVNWIKKTYIGLKEALKIGIIQTKLNRMYNDDIRRLLIAIEEEDG